jgi:WD40 repeat protein
MILATAFDETGRRLFSCSIEGEVRVWDVAEQIHLESWSCHAGPISDLSVTDDGLLLTVGLDGSAGIWHSADGSSIRRLEGHEGGVHCVAAGSGLIATGSADGRIGLWDRETGAQKGFLDGHEETVTSVAFLDAETLISGSRDRTVRLWNLAEGTADKVLTGHDWWVTKVRVASGGRVVSTSEDGTLKVWSADSGLCEWTFEESPGPIWGLAVDPSGRQAVVGYGGEVIRVHLDDRTHEQLPKDAPLSGRAMNYSPDGGLLAIGQDSGDIELIDAAGPAIVGRLSGAEQRILSGIGAEDLITVGRQTGEVESEVPESGRTVHEGHGFFVYASRQIDHSRFATAAFDRRVQVWEVGRAEPLARFEHPGLIFSLVTDRARQRLMCAGGDAISLWDLGSGERLWHVPEGGVGGHLVTAFGADEGIVAGVGEAPVLKLWRVGGDEISSWPLPDAHNIVIEAVPGENRVVVGSAYGRVSLVDLGDGSSVALHGEHEDWIRIARVSEDGRKILTISQNGTGRVYDRTKSAVSERFDHPIVIGDFTAGGRVIWLDCLGRKHIT